MRLLIVVQRYGQQVYGGAEVHAREVAERLVRRGHSVEVLTSCALSYVDWTNAYRPGTYQEGGVTVHRLEIDRARNHRCFDPLAARVLQRRGEVVYPILREWERQQGPYIVELATWMQEHSPAFDCALFFTYLYFTSWSGLASVRVPSILQPTAHDESSLHYPHFDGVFQLADAFAFSTHEERDLVLRRFATYRPSAVIGIGIDVDRSVDQVAFRRRFGLDDRPYVVSIGRIDSAKGSPELYRDFVQYKARHPGPLALVMIGQEVYKLPPHTDVVKTGFVEEAVRNSGIAGALAMIQPSPFESFSLVLCEAWALERPAMVQRRSAVLVGHARRSGAALAYGDYPEFETGLDLLLTDHHLRNRMGASGRAYVEAHYSWPAVLDRYERLLERVARPATTSTLRLAQERC